MKKISIILLISCITMSYAYGENHSAAKFTLGLEWGYIAFYNSGYHYNYFAPDGYRVDISDNSFRYNSNAEAYVHTGYDLNESWNISLYAGLTSILDYHYAVPISIRATRSFGKNQYHDCWFCFLDLGSGVSIQDTPEEIFTGKVGAGYRITLSRRTKLDLNITLRTVLTHPDVDYFGLSIPKKQINRNNLYASAISIGMSITL